MPTIVLEPDAPPIVRVLAGTLRRAAADAALASTMASMRGRVALTSTVDAQAATIDFAGDTVSVRHGADADADLTISADLNTMGQPDAAKPKVRGAARHPKLALAAAKVLDPPVEGGLAGAARQFWAWAADDPRRPASLRVVCTDDNAQVRDLTFGEDGPAAFEIHGPSWALIAVLTGSDHLGAAALEGRVRVIGDFATMNRMVGLVSRHMLGDE